MPPQQYPFSKNLYFAQKRMRAEDFIRDQEYMEGKLAFLTHWVLGEGTAVGLGVQRVDQESFLVQPGFAVDPQGRYVIVPEMRLWRLSQLEGPDQFEGENGVLWITGTQEEHSPMLVTENGHETERYTVAREQYRLTLRDASELPAPAAERQMFSDFVLFADEDIRITQSIPRLLPAGGSVQVRLFVECCCPEGVKAAVTYRPQISGFTGEDGGAPELCRELVLQPGETTLSLTLLSRSAGTTAQVRVDQKDFILEKNEQQYGPQAVFEESFPVVSGDMAQALRELLAGQDMQELWDTGGEGVPIARVRLLRVEGRCLLDEVTPLSLRYRTGVPWLEGCVERVLHCCGPDPQPSPLPPVPQPDPKPVPAPRHMTTGVVLLNTETNREPGHVLVSDEVAHGLGPGPVYVSFGVEELYPVVNEDRNDTDVLLGDPSLFAREGGSRGTEYDWGVRVRPEKGTFEMALRLREPPRRTTLRLRWYAWMPEELPHPPDQGGILVGLDPGVLRLRPGESACFTPVFMEGNDLPCEFSVEGRNSGSVTRDGRYTAPERAGLFTVCVQVKGKPKERARAFAIVTREGSEQSAGQNGGTAPEAVGAAQGGGND